MNKVDEKRLKADPRYKEICAGWKWLQDELAHLEERKQNTITSFESAHKIGRADIRVDSTGNIDESLFEHLRPRGDKCRVIQIGVAGYERATRDVEIENVTEKRVTFASLYQSDFDKSNGYKRKGHYGDYDGAKIHPDDLAKIQSGELKGWRNKEWGK